MKWTPLALIALVTSGCLTEEEPQGSGAADQTWVLAEARGFEPAGQITLTFPEEGRLAGQAPCNSYSAAVTLSSPLFEIEPFAATRRACPELATETAYLSALEKASQSEFQEDRLILSDDQGMLLVFRTDDGKR